MDEVFKADLLPFIPPVGHKWPTLHGTEVNTDRVVSPVLTFLRLPRAPIVAVEDGLWVGIVKGCLLRAGEIREGRIRRAVIRLCVRRDLGQLAEGRSVGIPPSDTRLRRRSPPLSLNPRCPYSVKLSSGPLSSTSIARCSGLPFRLARTMNSVERGVPGDTQSFARWISLLFQQA